MKTEKSKKNFRIIAFLLSFVAQSMFFLLLNGDTALFNNQVMVSYLIGALIFIPSDIIFVSDDLKPFHGLKLVTIISSIVVYLFMSLTILGILYPLFILLLVSFGFY